MFLKLCKYALDITIFIFSILLWMSISLLLIGIGVWLYHINIILGIVATPILVYLIILILLGVAYLDDISKKIKQRKENKKSLKNVMNRGGTKMDNTDRTPDDINTEVLYKSIYELVNKKCMYLKTLSEDENFMLLKLGEYINTCKDIIKVIEKGLTLAEENYELERHKKDFVWWGICK